MKYLLMLGMVFGAVSLQAQNHQNTYPLDSTVYESFNQYWYKHFKQAYLYDGYLNTTEYTYYNWHDPDAWRPNQRYQYTFDSRNLFTTYLMMNRDSEGWINARKTEYNYDNNENQTGFINYRWIKETNSWLAYMNTQYERGISGRLFEATAYRDNPENGEWMLYWQMEYFYNEFGQLVQINSDDYMYADGSYSGSFKEYYEYNSAGLQTSHIVTHSDTNTDPWLNSIKEVSVYDIDGRILSYTEYGWPSQAEDWDPQLREEYQYDSRGNEILKIESSKYIDSLQVHRKLQKYYNQMNQMDSCLLSSYNSRDAIWRQSNKNEYHYDAFGNLIQDVTFQWRSNDNQYYVKEQTRYFYPASSGVSDDNLDDRIVVYPNPGSGKVYIEGLRDLAKVSIHNMNGRVIKSITLNGNSIDISDLPPGLYFLHIFSKDEKPHMVRLMKL